MKQKDFGMTLVAAGLATYVLQQLRLAPYRTGQLHPAYSAESDCHEVNARACANYAVDPDALIYEGDVVAVRSSDGSTYLAPYCDELLLLGGVLGRVSRV